MKSTTVYLSGDTAAMGSQTIYYNQITSKGAITIDFDFNQIDSTSNNILRAVVDYGDGSDAEKYIIDVSVDHSVYPITYYIARDGSYSPVYLVSHSYLPSTISSSYFNMLSANILLQYIDGTQTTFIIPIRIAHESYYDAIGKASILNTQLVDNLNSDIFCIVQNEVGDVINVVLS